MLKKDRSEIYLSFDVNGKHLMIRVAATIYFYDVDRSNAQLKSELTLSFSTQRPFNSTFSPEINLPLALQKFY